MFSIWIVYLAMVIPATPTPFRSRDHLHPQRPLHTYDSLRAELKRSGSLPRTTALCWVLDPLFSAELNNVGHTPWVQYMLET
jgi:hypothetical protein